MYRNHFGLNEKPFRIAPSPSYLYPSETHDESRARLLYGIRESRGFVVIHGKVGLGKTTVLLSSLEELESDIQTALIFHPVRTFEHLLRMMVHEFGLEDGSGDEIDLLQRLSEFFVKRLAAGESCVLIIDEAQNLSLELLESIRTLSNLQTEEASLLQIVLVGQPELFDKLMDPRLVQLRQRVGIWHEIKPLDPEETADYIHHRLHCAGARRPKDIISRKLAEEVHTISNGVPRIVNQVCDTALLIAFGRDHACVTLDHMEEAARELHLGEGPLEPVVVERKRAKPRSVSRDGASSRERTNLRRVLLTAAAIIITVAALGMAYSEGWLQRLTAGPDLVVGSPLASGVDLASIDESAAQETTPNDQPEEIEAEVLAMSTTTAKAEDAHAMSPRLSRQVAAIEQWRDEGRIIYSVHLHSFKERERAERFAALLSNDESWDQPLFLEETGETTRWYRVLAGGYEKASEATDWIRNLKDRRGVGYAQLMPLASKANLLLPKATTLAKADTGEQG